MNMIDAKYGMKYPFPHVITHIIDNSAYDGTVPTVYADDPSLFSTLVVGAFPMGEDKKLIRLQDTTVPRVCYGLNNITMSDREKYGQVVDYPVSLISQGAPVQILRVTPEDATYAFTTIFVSYKWASGEDGNEPIFHVKFETDHEPPVGSVLSNFKNPERLAQALINEHAKNSEVDGWTKRVFAVIVAAGRGAVYNNMRMAIDTVSQGRRPTNVRYSFGTIDSRNSNVIEEFVATLVNIDNPDSVVNTVNTTVNQRTKGASVLKPIVNEKAVIEVFNEYKKRYGEVIDSGRYINDEFVNNTYKTLNVNTFDIITGKYIYGGGLDTDLPFYQVDAEDPAIPRLPVSNRIYTVADSTDPPHSQVGVTPEVLENKLLNTAYGVVHNGNSVYLGDVYLTTTGSKYNNPRLVIVCGINQYTQAITSVAFNSVYPLDTSDATPVVNRTATKPIKKVYDTTPTSEQLTADGIATGDIYAVIASSDTSAAEFTLYIKGDSVDTAYTQELVISAIPYTTKPGMENIIALYDSTAEGGPVWILDKRKTVIGYPVIDIGTGLVYINGYKVTAESAGLNDRVLINDNTLKFGNVPTTAGTVTDIIGQSYDIMAYDEADVTKWSITKATIVADSSTVGFNLGDVVATNGTYELLTASPADWSTNYTRYFTFDSTTTGEYVPVTGAEAPAYAADTYYRPTAYDLTTEKPADWDTNYTSYFTFNTTSKEYEAVPKVTGDDPIPTWVAATYYAAGTVGSNVQFTVTGIDENKKVTELTPIAGNASASVEKIDENNILLTRISGGTGIATVKVNIAAADNVPYSVKETATPVEIERYVVGNVIGSLYKISVDGVKIPDDYYSPTYGENLSTTYGGVALDKGSAGFLDDDSIDEITFKYKYAALLVEAFRGQIDPSIMSTVRTPAKFLFDAGFNTVVGASFLTPVKHSTADWINGSVIFTDDEKDEILFNPDLIKDLDAVDIDVKQAMYDLMIERVYERIPEDKRPIGPGSGFQVLFDSCLTDGETAIALEKSFDNRFDNPNASWDLGGITTVDGYTYTFVKRSVDNLVRHCKSETINVPFTGNFTTIAPTEYVSVFPDIDANSWEERNRVWGHSANIWLPDSNGYLKRASQRTFYNEETSDLVQESNMRTLSQLCYLLKNKIEEYLYRYSDDSVLKTLKTECDTMFANWVGSLVDELDIQFERGLNTDGGDIVICRVKVVFRGLILRVPIIVDVQRRRS